MKDTIPTASRMCTRQEWAFWIPVETTYTTCGMKAMSRRKRSLFSLFLRMQRVGLTLPIRGAATFDSKVFISPHRRVTKQFITITVDLDRKQICLPSSVAGLCTPPKSTQALLLPSFPSVLTGRPSRIMAAMPSLQNHWLEPLIPPFASTQG